jgi:capsule polysaccharide export protein KpsC/LpsZ
MHEWIEKTIQWFENQDNLELVIRIHPAELTGKIVTNDPVKNFLADKFPHLSENIKIVGPDEEISTYALMELADLGLIFATKAGLELAVKGVPLVIAGESWLRGHGFSNDPVSQKQYFELLEKFKSGVQKLQVDKEAALNFAHYFFFEKSITVNSVSSINRYPYLRPKITNNWSNSDPGLMRIIQGIESGKYEF